MGTAVSARPEVSIIIPARNEEVSLGACLNSLEGQSGVEFEIIVVDDGSTDKTREIAESFAGIRIVTPGPLPARWTGKNNAVVAGARDACGEWLLFTDADTVHLPGSLARALTEAKQNRADLLSYSPEQIVMTFTEKAAMPVIFSELAAQYPPEKVRDQSSGVVAANGQYILCRREAYEMVRGHTAVAEKILDDVALAQAFRAAGYRIYFRYGADAVRTRMYRKWSELRDGWTKNLALLFPRPIRLASWLLGAWIFSGFMLLVGVAGAKTGSWRLGCCVLPSLLLYTRIARAQFRTGTNVIAICFGIPLFAYLLVRSRNMHRGDGVSWKGRTYSTVSESPKPGNRLLSESAGVANK